LFIASDKTLNAGIPAIYSHLQSKGWRVAREHLLVKDFPVQFLAASGLTEEAVREAKPIEYEGVPAKVFRPEHIIAIAASVGGHKDLARIEQLMSSNDCLYSPHARMRRSMRRCWTTFCGGIT